MHGPWLVARLLSLWLHLVEPKVHNGFKNEITSQAREDKPATLSSPYPLFSIAVSRCSEFPTVHIKSTLVSTLQLPRLDKQDK